MNKTSTIDFVFTALANPVRRRMLDVVKQLPGCNVNGLSEHFDMSRIGVMKHLKILIEANLIVSQKQGRDRRLFFNAVPIQMIYDRWTDEYSAFWVTQAVDLKYEVESAGGQQQTSKTKSKSTRKTKTGKSKKRVA